MRTSFLSGSISWRDLREGLSATWSLKSSESFLHLKKGSSFIRVRKRNTYPTTFILRKEDSFLFGYIESAFFKDIILKRNTEEAAEFLKDNHEVEYFLGIINPKEGTITLLRDAFCTAPIFYIHRDGVLRFSNLFESLVPYVTSKGVAEINFRALAEYLLFLEGDTQTIFEHIKILTERSILTKKSRSMQLTLPLSAAVIPKQKSYKDPLSLFSEELETTLKYYIQKISETKSVGFEVSGGIDSATAPGFYATYFRKPLKIFSMILPAEAGLSQQKKIRVLVRRFSFLNKEILIREKTDFPLASHVRSKKLQAFYPWREIYYEALSKLAGQMQKEGIRVVFTGMGGDELFKIDPGEERGFQGRAEARKRGSLVPPRFFTKEFLRKFHTTISAKSDFPTPAVPYSVIGANASRNNIYIEKGIWPVAPLANPSLVALCRSLPSSLRRDKKILKMYQESAGYPRAVSYPARNENFTHFFDESLRKPLRKFLLNLYERSFLAKSRLINKKALVKEYQLFVEGKTSDLSPLYFYAIAVIEIILKAIRAGR